MPTYASDTAAAASPAARRPLRVAVVLSGCDVPAWQLAVLKRLAESDYAQIVGVVVDAEAAARTPAFDVAPAAHSSGAVGAALRRIVSRLEANMVSGEDAFAAADARPIVGAVSTLVRNASNDGALADALHGWGADVFIDFAISPLATRAAGAAKHGVWRVRHPHSEAGDASAAGFWPVYHGSPVSEAAIESIGADGARGIIATTFPATNRYSVKLNASSMYWRIASFLPQALRKLGHSSAGDTLETVRADRAAHIEPPSAAQLVVHIARNVTRRARASVARRCTNDQWILMYRFGDALSTSPAQFRKIVPPKDRFWADPHVVHRDGGYYAFIEECPFATGKGHIAVMRIDENGARGEAVKVLERDYHLSYPFVFEHAGELYMVPESEANRTVDLYRCVRFPEQWEFVTTLMSDITATDSTLVCRDGRWWLFANVVDTAGASFSEELSLFYSDSLFGGEWKPHPRNPIVSDARRARPAGAIIERDGRLYRPAQDCSVRYGYGIRLHEIETLSTDDYSEREVETIFPTWDARIVATHTLSYTHGLTVIDAIQPRLRFC